MQGVTPTLRVRSWRWLLIGAAATLGSVGCSVPKAITSSATTTAPPDRDGAIGAPFEIDGIETVVLGVEAYDQSSLGFPRLRVLVRTENMSGRASDNPEVELRCDEPSAPSDWYAGTSWEPGGAIGAAEVRQGDRRVPAQARDHGTAVPACDVHVADLAVHPRRPGRARDDRGVEGCVRGAGIDDRSKCGRRAGRSIAHHRGDQPAPGRRPAQRTGGLTRSGISAGRRPPHTGRPWRVPGPGCSSSIGGRSVRRGRASATAARARPQARRRARARPRGGGPAPAIPRAARPRSRRGSMPRGCRRRSTRSSARPC